MQKGSHSTNWGAAISVDIKGAQNPTEVLIVRDSLFRSDLSSQTMFVRNNTHAPIDIKGNKISGNVAVLAAP